MSDLLETQMREADELFEGRRWDDALARYEAVLQGKPSIRRALNRVAFVHALRGRISKLVETCFRWQESLEQAGDFVLAAEVSSAVLRFEPDSVDARTALLRHLEKQADKTGYVELARREARFFMEAGRGEISLQVLGRALELFPEDNDLSVALADMCVAQGHLQEAVQLFRRLASRFEADGDPTRAADAYRRLKLLLPEAPDVSMRLAELHLTRGRFDDAITEFRNVLRTSLTHRDALIGLGKASMQKGSQRDATLAFRKVLSLDSRDAEAHGLLGDVYRDQGMADDAIKEYLAAALLYLDHEDYEMARQAYGAVLEIDEENPAAVRGMFNVLEADRSGGRRPRKTPATAEEPPLAPQAGADSLVPPTPAPPPLSEDELYASEPLPDAALLGAARGEELLGAPVAPPGQAGPEFETAEEPKAGYGVFHCEIPRILVDPIPGEGLMVPTPVLFLRRLDLLDLVRAQIEQAPDPEEIHWEPLPELDAEAVRAREILAGPGERSEATTVPSGPIKSAFGVTGGFSQAMASGGRSRRRSGEFLSSERVPRGRAHGPQEPDAHLSLAERIARARRGEEDSDK